MLGPTISPHDPDVALVRCDMTGMYLTKDGGCSWRMINLRSWVAALAFDPSEPGVIYAANMALWRSEDAGSTWRMVWPDPRSNTVEHMRGDHSDPLLVTDDASYPSSGRHATISAIAIHPSDPAHLVVAIKLDGEPATALHESRDRGASWTHTADLGPSPAHLVLIGPASAGQSGRVCAVTSTDLHLGDGGAWIRHGCPARVGWATGAWIADAAAPVVYITAHGGEPGVWAWDGRVGEWRPCAEALARDLGCGSRPALPRLSAIGCCAAQPSIAYVGFEGLRSGGEAEQPSNGIAKTTDGGLTWTVVHEERDRPSANLEASWIEQRAPGGRPSIWFDDPVGIGVAPTDPGICYATDLFRTYRTLDGGRTWRQANSLRDGDDSWTTTGLDVTTCYGVHFDPFDDDRIYITYTDIGLFASPDRGRSWVGATEGIPPDWRNTTYWVAFDEAVPGLMWGAFGFNHDLPRPKMWAARDPSDYRGGVAVSADHGRTWRLVTTGMQQTAVTHLLVDPTSPIGKRTLYACGFGRGIYKSVDNGETWVLRNSGIGFRQPFAWRLTRAANGTLYLIVARRAEVEPVGPDESGALYVSRDGAGNWTRMALPPGVTGPCGLALDPSDQRRMYLAAWGLAGDGDDTGGGAYVSEDGGVAWRRMFAHGDHVYDVTVDPTDPDVLYVCGFDAAAWRSADRGKTWHRLRGYNFKWGHRVIVDPSDPSQVYITTFGGSVWHGPAVGDPDAVGDIVGPYATHSEGRLGE